MMIEKEVRSRPRAARYLLLGMLLVLVVAGATAAAQFDGYYQVHYNGQFTFTRIIISNCTTAAVGINDSKTNAL